MKLPVISGKELIQILQKKGFVVLRIKGSHHRMKHEDGRITTIPVHSNDPLPKGLLHKIITLDLEVTIDEFCKWILK
ncbi:MAG: type II toxin-antitoxin system HicA family toxin [Bacteroidetes bacterium]|nr:type II toxin-antitoxin system HicA family toxin [Bacteroidota bacterium]